MNFYVIGWCLGAGVLAAIIFALILIVIHKPWKFASIVMGCVFAFLVYLYYRSGGL